MKLRVVNVICTGRLPFKKLDFHKIMEKSFMDWNLVNEEMSPILSVRFKRKDGKKNVHHKKKCICVSIWTSNAINIVGLRSLQEGNKYYDKILKELNRIGCK